MSEVMKERWRMNRLGFVNFWLYDNEIFDVSGGKLLLRGQNGSGKSITTQSFIPFILDGDRTPSRLDPFGSNDRKMEYYFLGDNEKEDATGYLFLEFVKPSTNQYRTIGIGQRAQKGKGTLGFWSFILKDNRRIGIDISLYRDVSGSRLPLTRKECRDLVMENEGNLFLESQSEYKKAVNQNLFGFPAIEQYEQFVKLLIKVRAPKLSKEFKPSKVYEILNDSLQTLSDEDLFPMVEAMEKMDEIEDRLTQFKTTRRELKYLLDEYQRYNEYIAGKKAEHWLTAKKEAEDSLARCKTTEETISSALKEQETALTKRDELKHTINILNDRIQAYSESGIEEQLRHEEDLKIAQKEKNTDLSRIDGTILDLREKILVKERECRSLESSLEHELNEISRILDSLKELNETVQYTNHDLLASLKDAEEGSSLFARLRKELAHLEEELRSILADWKDLSDVRVSLSEAEAQADKAHKECRTLQKALETSEEAEDEERDHLIEAFHMVREHSLEYRFTTEELTTLAGLVRSIQGSSDTAAVLEWENGIRNRSAMTIMGLLQNERSVKERLMKEIARLKEELEDLETAKEIVPERNEASIRARVALAEAGIEAIPLYEAIDFESSVEDHTRILLEEALERASLLDALLVSEADRSRTKALLKEHSDLLIEPESACSSPVSFFTLSETDCSLPLQKEIRRFLSCISEPQQVARFVLGEDGYFRNGILEGYVSDCERTEVRYIGAEMRRRAQERKIREKRQELEAAENALQCSNELIALLNEHSSILDEEYRSLPSIKSLLQRIEVHQECLKALAAKEAEAVKLEETKEGLRMDLLRKETALKEKMRVYPYEPTREGYETVLSYLKDYILEAEQLEREIRELRHQKNNLATYQIMIDSEQAQLFNEEETRSRINKELNRIAEQLRAIEEILSSPDIQKLREEIKMVRTERTAAEQGLEEAKETIIRLETELKHLQESYDSLRETSTLLQDKEARLQEYLKEELALGLLKGSEEEDLFLLAKELKEGIREADRNLAPDGAVARLFKAHQVRSSAISSTLISIRECFAEGNEGELRRRYIITASISSKEVDISEYSRIVDENIANTELLIQEKDRELFETILSDTLSRKLTARIAESRSWIKDMSELMKQMDSSMGLSFSLRWVPKAAEADGQLGAGELETILARDRELLREEDIRRVAEHFRTEIRLHKEQAKENNLPVNYTELVREALDYRRWFEFRMSYTRTNENTKELTDRAFNTFSGGEKAMAMYIPLFASVNAQYRKSRHADHPRLIALDEAFAGVDHKNISSMFELVEKLDFDYIMNSQSLWGCYESVRSLKIAELLRPENAKFITVISYEWNGKERILNDH